MELVVKMIKHPSTWPWADNEALNGALLRFKRALVDLQMSLHMQLKALTNQHVNNKSANFL